MADGTDPFPKLQSVYKKSGSNMLTRGVENIQLNSEQTGNLGKSQNEYSSAPRPWILHSSSSSSSSSSSVWGQPNAIQKLVKWGNVESAVENGITWQANNALPKNVNCKEKAGLQEKYGALNDKKVASLIVVSPPAQGSYLVDQAKDFRNTQSKNEIILDLLYLNDNDDENDYELIDDDSEIIYDSDDDISYDESQSDSGLPSHEILKKSKWFRAFFDNLDKLTLEEINSQARKWHCPACYGGSGAIDWYHGLQNVLIHAGTKTARRAKLHRLFAEILVEEFRRRGASITVSGEAYDKWEGLDERVKDYEIVWPPMLVIMNTRYEQDENNKWIGMGNQELLDYFSSYAALKARHSYGPQGHRGMSVLVFESSAAGYLEALRLHKHFKEQGRDRDAWDHHRTSFVPGGKRQLYGYLALKEDLDIFNRHCQGKSKLKFEMRSYQENVESKIKHINDNSQQINQLKNKYDKVQKISQVIAESLSKVSDKLRQTKEENSVLRQRTRMQHEQNKEEMDALEKFFGEQMKIIQQALETKEENFEKLQQEKRKKVIELEADCSEGEDHKHRLEKIASFISSQNKEIDQFVAERDMLEKILADKKLALKRKIWEEDVALEKEFANELIQLMEKYNEK
ncbi:suppressor of gene silencing protein [Quillaja saponaria]|uniref:Suppressor of gene silencing protein n=1 Tax=Quillaja saponaria TaxID=32244 RepID=A0AAD7P9G2_QUISA|nr:suppressor of gene silencing protein [Quillaja saponaria]KAJ7946650.1 suppressor of gene silencing protein [Quillaja saponaria]